MIGTPRIASTARASLSGEHPPLIRFLLALLLVLLRPDPAAASMAASGASEPDRFVATDPEFVFGAVRSGSGWELLLQLQGRVTARAKSTEEGPRSVRHARLWTPTSAHDLLPLRTRRFIRSREIDLRRADSVCLYYEPCQAKPPPLS